MAATQWDYLLILPCTGRVGREKADSGLHVALADVDEASLATLGEVVAARGVETLIGADGCAT